MATRKSRRAAAKQQRKRTAGRGRPRLGAGLTDEMTDTLQLGKACWDKGKRDEAIDLYERGVRQTPNNVRAHLLAARAYAERCRLTELDGAINRLMKLAPDHPGVFHFIGETYALNSLNRQAIEAYEKACALPGVLPGSWMALASLYERSHRLEEARDLAERAQRAGLKMPLLAITRAKIERRDKRYEESERLLSGLIEKLPADNEWSWRAWADIALLRDGLGNYEGAVEAISACKRGQLAKSGPEEETSRRVSARFRALAEAASADDFTRWHDQSPQLGDGRNALLAGFPRSGTTLLEQVLDAHPGLISSEERDFFGRVLFPDLHGPTQRQAPVQTILDGLTTDQIRHAQERYTQVMERLLGEPINGRVHLDKNPAYTPFIPVLLRLFPHMRLLIALRDPRDVVLSCYLRYLPLNPVSVNFLTVERTARRYALDMDAWLKFREIIPNPWCEVRYEDSVADLESQARRALETLGLPWDPAVMDYRDRLGTERQVNSPTYEAVKQPIYTRAVGRWKHYEEHLAPAFETLAPFVKAFGYEG